MKVFASGQSAARGMSNLFACLLVSLLLTGFFPIGWATPACADHLYFTFTDAVDDNTGHIDVTEMSMTFDNATGEYQAVFRSAAAEPFVDQFRINVNLWNPTAMSFFADTVNDFNLTGSSPVIILRGTSTVLPGWSAGDVVASNTLAGLGNPPRTTVFRTSVNSFPMSFLTNEDAIAYGPGGSTVVTMIMPQQAIEFITAAVDVLLATGSLTEDQSSGLRDKLGAATDSLYRGRETAACGQMSAFGNQVDALVGSDALTEEEGQELLGAIAAIEDRVGC